MIRNVLMALAMVAAVPAMTACSATSQRESTGEYIDSSVVSAKVRTAIAKDEKLSIFDIDVTTYRNV
ncbi:MAG TPA: transporter, partial [Alphaproteobacteria bacterium]